LTASIQLQLLRTPSFVSISDPRALSTVFAGATSAATFSTACGVGEKPLALPVAARSDRSASRPSLQTARAASAGPRQGMLPARPEAPSIGLLLPEVAIRVSSFGWEPATGSAAFTATQRPTRLRALNSRPVALGPPPARKLSLTSDHEPHVDSRLLQSRNPRARPRLA